MKIATWNMQGLLHNAQAFSTLSAVKARMINENIDVFCLQECGDIPSVIVPAPIPPPAPVLPLGIVAFMGINIRTTSRPFLVDIYYYQNLVNIRCSMAILVTSGLAISAHLYAIGILGTRPILGIVVPYIGGNLLVANLHAPAGPIGITCDYVASAINLLMGLPVAGVPNYVLAGDFNTPPATYAITPTTVLKPAMNAITPTVATHNGGGLLDYFETNLILLRLFAGAISSSVSFSDHRQVYAIF